MGERAGRDEVGRAIIATPAARCMPAPSVAATLLLSADSWRSWGAASGKATLEKKKWPTHAKVAMLIYGPRGGRGQAAGSSHVLATGTRGV